MTITFDPHQIMTVMESINAKYLDTSSTIVGECQYTTIELMCESLISPKGKEIIEISVEKFNNILDTLEKETKFFFDKLNNAFIKIETPFTDDYSIYRRVEFESSFARFNSNNAKDNLNGNMYIYDSKIERIIAGIEEIGYRINDLLEEIMDLVVQIPIGGNYGEAVMYTIISTYDTLKSEIGYEIEFICGYLSTSFSDTSDEVIQAKKNALDAIELGNK